MPHSKTWLSKTAALPKWNRRAGPSSRSRISIIKVLTNHKLDKAIRVHSFQLKGDSAFYANGVLVRDMCGLGGVKQVAAGKGVAILSTFVVKASIDTQTKFNGPLVGCSSK